MEKWLQWLAANWPPVAFYMGLFVVALVWVAKKAADGELDGQIRYALQWVMNKADEIAHKIGTSLTEKDIKSLAGFAYDQLIEVPVIAKWFGFITREQFCEVAWVLYQKIVSLDAEAEHYAKSRYARLG